MIQFQNISFSYPQRSDPVFSNFSIHFPQGKITVVLGPNGCGKSTLFHLAYGWLHPDSGQIILGEQDIRTISRREMGKQIAILPQFEHAPFHLSVQDYVLMGRTPHQNFVSRPTRQDVFEVEKAIERVEMTGYRAQPVSHLSGGEQQLVYIARVLAQDTPVILLDEITTHLDLHHIQIVLSLLQKLRDEGKTIVMTMHDPNLASALADEVVLLLPDRTYRQGYPDIIFTAENLSHVFAVSVPIHQFENQIAINWNAFLK